MINIIISEQFLTLVDATYLEKAALATLAEQNPDEDVNLSIVIADDQQLNKLNLVFRGIDSSTDVLSFFEGELDPENGQYYLGDVVISFPQAEKQAMAAGHNTASELELLVIHGVLHLLGFDHATDIEKEEMWQIQKNLLGKLGVAIKKLPE